MYAVGGIACLLLFFFFFVMREAMGAAPPLIALVMDIFVIFLPVLAILAFLYPFTIYRYTATKEIVFTKNGVLLKRGFRPVTIQKITDLKVRTFRGKEVSATITGLTPEGTKVRKTLGCKRTGLEKRWEEFKADLRKIKTK